MRENIMTYIVTLPPPTPNGGIHVGHMSGPFLAADIFAKYLKISGKQCFTTCYSDVNQSYVRVTAEKQSRDPAELSSYWTADMEKTFEKMNVEINDYFSPNEEGSQFVRNLFHKLYERGVLLRKPFPFFKSRSTGLILDEAGVSGICPSCLSGCKCGICEACGNLTSAGTLLNPRSTIDGSVDLDVIYEEVMVLEVEQYRAQIKAFYASNTRFRTRYLWLIDDALQNPLPDFPITLPSLWGIQIDHPDFPGQSINAWPEIMAQLIYSYRRAHDIDAHMWGRAAIVNFFGFDNSYFYALIHVAMLNHIDDGKWLPHATMINEFYNLDHAKFSTSNNHVVWASDLLNRHSADAARFFAVFNNPGMEKANFNEVEMSRVTTERLIEPWCRIALLYNNCNSVWGERPLIVSPAARRVSALALERIQRSYSLERFHLRQAAEDILHFQAYIEAYLSDSETLPSLADASYMLCEFARAAYPIMPNGCNALYSGLTNESLPTNRAVAELQKTNLSATLFG